VSGDAAGEQLQENPYKNLQKPDIIDTLFE